MTPEERIQKLEEAQAFSERAMEELSLEVRDLGKRIADLAAALKQVELKLVKDSHANE